MNRAILVGNIGADPELRYTANGTAVLSLRIATSEKWRDSASGDLKERTDWHTIVVWGPRALGLEKHISKGDKLAIEGKIRVSTYEDKEGIKRTKSEIHADSVDFCGRRRRARDDDPTEQQRAAMPLDASGRGATGIDDAAEAGGAVAAFDGFPADGDDDIPY